MSGLWPVNSGHKRGVMFLLKIRPICRKYKRQCLLQKNFIWNERWRYAGTPVRRWGGLADSLLVLILGLYQTGCVVRCVMWLNFSQFLLETQGSRNWGSGSSSVVYQMTIRFRWCCQLRSIYCPNLLISRILLNLLLHCFSKLRLTHSLTHSLSLSLSLTH